MRSIQIALEPAQIDYPGNPPSVANPYIAVVRNGQEIGVVVGTNAITGVCMTIEQSRR